MSRVTRKIDTIQAKTEHGSSVRINVFQEQVLSRIHAGLNEANGSHSYETVDGTPVTKNQDGSLTILGSFGDTLAFVS
jgi:hypothetical protein